MQVEIWSDVVCPWCYLGKRRFEKALEQLPFRDEVEVVHRSFQLDPTAPHDHTVETAAHLASKYGLTKDRAAQMQREMEGRAAQDGLEYHLDGQRSGNTFTAHRLLHLAKTENKQGELIEAMYRAYFTDGRSLFTVDELATIANEVGLDPDDVETVLNDDKFTADVEADIEQARAYGITGVPFYVLNSKFAVSGAQSVDVFREALERAYQE